MTVSQQMAVKYLKKGASFSSSPQITHELPVGLHFLCIAQCSAGKQQDTRSRTGPHRTRKSTPVSLSLSLSLCVSLGFFQFLCSFFPLTFHPHSLLTCLQVHYTGYSNWSLQPFLPPSIIARATSMGVCTSYAQDSVLRTRETTAMRSLHTTTRESPRVTMKTHHQIRSDQSLSHVRLFATP